MVNKILIRKSDRKTLHKDRRSLGMNGENLQEVLIFCLDEKIEGNGIVEVELPNGEKGMIEVDRTEEGYELPVKSSLLTQTGFVKFQLRILHDNEEIFKSEIIPLEVKDSINATATIPEEYPSWVDTLTNLKKDLEKAESERVSNEEERQTAEEARQENFTEMQKTVKSAVSNIKDLKEDYNTNAKKKTDEFNNNFEEKQKAINDNAEAKTTAFGENAEAQTKTFNTNSDDKLAEYNRNHTDKIKEYDDNSKAKLDAYNKNDTDKINAYNANDIAKTKAYNDNTVLKEKAYNNNASNKTETFNSNAESKQNEYNQNAENKLTEYNQNAEELINKVEQVQAENEALKAENKLIKEQIPSASASGNSVHIEDSGTLDFDWKINGRHYQKQTIQNDNFLILEDTTITKNGITLTIKDGVITINGTSTASTNIDFKIKKKLKAGTYWHLVQRSGDAPSGNVAFLVMKSGGIIATINGRGGVSFTLNEDTEVFYRIWTDKNNIISNVAYKCSISEGSDSKPWVEGIPDSPSIDYASEIETVGSNVNLCDNSKILVGVDPKDSSEKDFRTSDYIKVEYGKSYIASLYNEKKVRIGNLVYQEWNKNLEKLQQITTDTIKITNQDIAYVTVRNYRNDAEEIKNEFYYKFEESLIATPYSPYGMGSAEIKVDNGLDTTDINYKSQTKVLPIQQEMLEGDYVADVEHHEWGKYVFTGDEDWQSNWQNTDISDYIQFYLTSSIFNNNFLEAQGICNIFGKALDSVWNLKKEGYGINKDLKLTLQFKFLKTRFTTVKDFKACLKSKYDEGNPVIVYYKLATPVDLELTEEQKAVRDTKLYTYKNITNISLSDELASVEVEYKKDQDTINKNYENRLAALEAASIS